MEMIRKARQSTVAKRGVVALSLIAGILAIVRFGEAASFFEGPPPPPVPSRPYGVSDGRSSSKEQLAGVQLRKSVLGEQAKQMHLLRQAERQQKLSGRPAVPRN